MVTVAALPSFEDFYRDHHHTVVRALAITLRDHQLATEAGDEAMARAFARWATVQRLDSPAGWTYRVGLNWSRSVLRRGTGPRRVLHERDDDTMPVRDHDLQRALSKLDIERRAVVVCRYFLGMSEAETAAALGVRLGTVKSRLSRALRQLQHTLGDPEEDRR
jgi:RNA polymerase sigma-70 factor (ECF subfamily)